MRTLATQVRLRRLLRTFAEVVDRLLAEPSERSLAISGVSRLQSLAEGVREAWDGEAAAGRPEEALVGYVDQALRTAELAIAGLNQAGADLELLRADFESAALPLEVFLRGLDAQPVLERSA
ncbi:MAG TPA: hypothetical protein VGV88_04540 [Candidatus Dormibacteraeota bacterium]|nr:hypothetical protein [Candidatus Dormibacteraeota bacterium]